MPIIRPLLPIEFDPDPFLFKIPMSKPLVLPGCQDACPLFPRPIIKPLLAIPRSPTRGLMRVGCCCISSLDSSLPSNQGSDARDALAQCCCNHDEHEAEIKQMSKIADK